MLTSLTSLSFFVLPALALPAPFLPILHERSSGAAHRIAVIGGGPSGSSAAYFAQFLSDQGLLPSAEITLYEEDAVIGGRCAVSDIATENGNASAEMGASLFTSNNENIMRAIDLFDLPRQAGQSESAVSSWPQVLWDGQTFRSPTELPAVQIQQSAVAMQQNALGPFLNEFEALYSPEVQGQGPFETIPDIAEALGWRELYQTTGVDYLDRKGVNGDYVAYLLGAGTAGNYGQSPVNMHAAVTLVSWAANGASSIKGGNYQIFEHFAHESGANVQLQTRVKSLRKVAAQSGFTDNSSAWEVTAVHGPTGESSTETFDSVIVAAPWHSTGIEVVNSDAAEVVGPAVPYEEVHVTLVATNTTELQACFFEPDSEDCGKTVDPRVLSTLVPWTRDDVPRRPNTNNFSFIKPLEGTSGEWLAKIFSPADISDEDLGVALGGAENVLSVERKTWDAYPVLEPLSPEEFAPLRLDDGLYYTSPMERLISTMETSIVSSWNVASLMTQDLTGNTVTQSWPRWNSTSTTSS